MNVYRMLGNSVGTPEAIDLGERLSAWHDAMVAHERGGRGCHDDCPHADAAVLWDEALETLGDRAEELRFLRARAGLRIETSHAGAGGPRRMEAGA